ncbi:hypothetical protein DEO72_LG3g1341 [Vigna unguiculata]|uniref:Uncharacterized protein n=1 Tax=Vigna unguiculata TaxID=3917 RepID=A0A4D6LER0_VIGUN|nr:hypothetical protein DEO72_LG3g1341 [Vigna unguiculata]
MLCFHYHECYHDEEDADLIQAKRCSCWSKVDRDSRRSIVAVMAVVSLTVVALVRYAAMEMNVDHGSALVHFLAMWFVEEMQKVMCE